MASPAGPLSHRSALCVVPHRSAWAQIQDVRCVHDRAFRRWPPHINLLYPFLPDDAAGADFAAAAQLACRRLSTMATFTASPNSATPPRITRSCACPPR